MYHLGEYFWNFFQASKKQIQDLVFEFSLDKKIRHGIGDLTAPPLGDGVSWSETGPEELVRIFVDS